jgi:hypothetical protein
MNIIIKNRLILFISIISFITSLFQMGFCVNYKCENDGFTNLFMGWLTIVTDPILFFIWLANPILFFSWFFLKNNYKTSLKLSIISMILMFSFLFCNNITSSTNKYKVLSPITSIKIGYWLWVFSSLTILIGSVYLLKKKQEK